MKQPRLPLALVLVLGLFACRPRTNEAERIAIARWQGMVASVRDPGALTALRRRARAGSVDAKRALGVALTEQSDASLRGEGLQWLGRAAEGGSGEAAFALGKLEMLGAPGVAVDYSRAAAHLRAAAAQHEPRANYYLALMARDGYGREVDLVEAARNLDEAARAGLPAAMFLLADAYREGKGCTRDDKRALELYEAAAEKEHPASIQALAIAYRNGELGLAPDPAKYETMLAELAHSHRHAPPQP